MSEVNGSGDINIKGSAQKATLTVNGSEILVLKNWLQLMSLLQLRGSGDIVCYASRQLDAELVVVVILNIKGSPSVVNKQGKKNSITGK